MPGSPSSYAAAPGTRGERRPPSSQRYTGHFYEHAEPELAEAVSGGRVLIISGGYGPVLGQAFAAFWRGDLGDGPPD